MSARRFGGLPLLAVLALRFGWLLLSQSDGSSEQEPPAVGHEAHPVGSPPAARLWGPRRAELGRGQPSPLRQLAADVAWIVRSWLRPAGAVADWQQGGKKSQ